jgi:hypothetical protein
MDHSKVTPFLVEAANAMRVEYQEKFQEQEKRIQRLEEEIALFRNMLLGNTEK